VNNLGPLYHWSPRNRLNGIKRQGLMPGKRNIGGPVYHGKHDDPNLNNADLGTGEYRQESISFSLDPVTAWSYSHEVFQSKGTFDLWLVHLIDSDEVHILPSWGGNLVEIRVTNRIRKARLHWVGERTV
jgi:hypothetical protein